MATSGEFELIAKLRERLAIEPGTRPRAAAEIAIGSGDDAAVTVPRGATATSVDIAIEGVHFRRETATPEDIGHKALAAALSDLAAMGAEAGEAYVQLGLPEAAVEDEALRIADGLAGLARKHAVAVVGGDISRAPALLLAVTVVGHAGSAEALVGRSGARPAEELYVSGELGGAAAGLLLLERPELGDGLDGELTAALKERQLRPRPRLEAGLALAAAGASAMIDVSDGLVADAGHIAAASGVELTLEAEALPLAPGVAEVAERCGTDALRLGAGGGEDYELLVSLPDAAVGTATARLGELGVELSRVGRVAAGSGARLAGRSGDGIEVAAYDHLRPRPRG